MDRARFMYTHALGTSPSPLNIASKGAAQFPNNSYG